MSSAAPRKFTNTHRLPKSQRLQKSGVFQKNAYNQISEDLRDIDLKLMHEYKGVIHVHTKFSDGSATIEDVVRKAQKANLDYVIITDHDTLDAMKYGYEGWHGGLLLLIGEEISPRRNHYLALGIKREIKGKYWRGKIQTLIDLVRDGGGIGIIAHPYGENPIKNSDHSWVGWKYDGYDGLEIWSYMMDWVRSVNFISAFYYHRHPEKAISGPNPSALRKWDEIAMKRHIVGIGSIDAHGRGVPVFRFIKFLPYEYLFQTIRTHILTPVPLKGKGERDPLASGMHAQMHPQLSPLRRVDPFRRVHSRGCIGWKEPGPSEARSESENNHDSPVTNHQSPIIDPKSKQMIYDAIKSGHCFIGYDLIADSSGFRFTAVVDDKNEVLMGDELTMDRSAKLEITTPLPAEIRLIRNGEQIKTQRGNSLSYETDQIGVYRVEVYLDCRPSKIETLFFLHREAFVLPVENPHPTEVRCYLPTQKNGQPWIFSNPIFLR